MARVVRARYEEGVLRPLEPLDLREGEVVVVVVRRSVREKLRGLVGILGESTLEEMEEYAGEAWGGG